MADVNPGALIIENRHTGEHLEIRRIATPEGDRLELKGSLPPHREGPPLHIHWTEDEVARVVSGTLSAIVGGKPVSVQAGAEATFPRRMPHRWWNEGDETLVLEGGVFPATDLDRYLQAVFEVLNAGPANRPPLFYMAHVCYRHRRTQAVLIGPRPVQTILFPIVVGLGKLLGKYRGTQWPGCPDRCQGAPRIQSATPHS